MRRLKLFFLVFAACLWGSGINMAQAQSSKDANGAVKKEVQTKPAAKPTAPNTTQKKKIQTNALLLPSQLMHLWLLKNSALQNACMSVIYPVS